MKIINKGGTDKTVILDVRQGILQVFEATNWTDLRFGWLFSICGPADPADDDRISGAPTLAEDLGDPNVPNPANRFWIGIKNIGSQEAFPGTPGAVFIGYCDGLLFPGHGNSNLVSSDAFLGTGTDYWRVNNHSGSSSRMMISDGSFMAAHDAAVIHAVQNFAGGHAPGYASLIMMRLKRSAPLDTSPITVTYKNNTPLTSSDVLFTSTPTLGLLKTNLETFPTTVSQIGPVTLSVVPDCFFVYWPFHNSRIRIHAMGVLKNDGT